MRLLLAVLSVTLAWGQQSNVNVTGTWRLNPEKTNFNGPGPKDVILTLTDTSDTLTVLDISTFADGRRRETRGSFLKDGRECTNMIGGSEARTSLRPDGRGYVEQTRFSSPQGLILRSSRITLSEDGTTLTVDVSLLTSKGHPPVRMVFDKSPAQIPPEQSEDLK
jgi:hypothetical protein